MERRFIVRFWQVPIAVMRRILVRRHRVIREFLKPVLPPHLVCVVLQIKSYVLVAPAPEETDLPRADAIIVGQQQSLLKVRRRRRCFALLDPPPKLFLLL